MDGSNSDIKICHMKYFFVKILLNFKKKIISLNKGKPSENTFNIAKNQNQEFELLISHHFKI